jgi:protein SCO1/2
MGQVPGFSLTAQDGRPFASAERLAGQVWVADFIYTTCPGPCPRMSRQMKQVQERLDEEGLGDVKLVSFTVDPEKDTPQALAEYARRYAADTSRWSFLTGTREELHALSREHFKVGDVDGALEHSTRFILVDGQGRIRQYYSTNDGAVISTLLADIKAVRREASREAAKS